MKFHAFYFSATGNTEKALRTAERKLKAAGHEVTESLVIAKSQAPDLSSCDCVIAAFPVLAKAPPVMFSHFLKRLPRGERADGVKIKAAVLAIDGGGGGYAGNRAASILEKRGYDVLSVAKACYPANWAQVNGVFNDERATKVMAKGEKIAMEFGSKLACGETSRETVRAKMDFLDAIFPPLYGLLGRRILGKLFYADEDCCSCGLCARTCPARTILFGSKKGEKPYWKANCENCNRCINVCPKGAIVSSIGRAAILTAAVIAGSWVGIRAYRSFVYPLFAFSMAPALAAVIDVLAISAIIIVAHIFAIGPLDGFVLRWLQRLPGLRRFFAWTYTKGKRRYVAAGFEPSRLR